MITILVEKPDMARKIAAALDGIKLSDGTVVTFSQLSKYEKAVMSIQTKNGYIPIKFKGQDCAVTHSYGHLFSLCALTDYDEDYKQWKNIDLPFIPKHYRLKGLPNTAKQFAVIKGLFNKSDLIINATDWDREGEAIFSYIYEKAECKTPYKRAYYHSMTEEEFDHAFNNLKDSADAKPGESAGRCRAIADWLIGINCTVAATLHSNANSVVSVGRVQTPTLAMIVQREKSIRDFVSKTYYVPKATFTTPDGQTYIGTNDTNFDSEKDAELFIKELSGRGTVTDIKSEIKKVDAPSLYSLSILQIEANSKFGYSANQTLEIAQSLYEKGYTTYPRTNSAYLPEDYKAAADRALTAISVLPEYGPFIIGRPKTYNKKYFNDAKIESHFAIVPTHVVPEKLTESERNIYDMICRSLIMTIYPPAKVKKVKIITSDSGNDFVTRGSTVIEKGWMEVGGVPKDKNIPVLSEGDKVKGSYEVVEKKTEPPKRYTQGDLIKAMVAADKDADAMDCKSLAELGVEGIGRESTRASIIETLYKRGYIENSKKSIMPTPKGIALIDGLPLEEIKSAHLTAMWESKLSDIERKKEDPDAFVKDIESLTKKWCDIIRNEMKGDFRAPSVLEKSDLKCPVCGNAVRKTPWGYGCSNYKAGCKFGINRNICDKKLTDKQIETLITKGETKEIKGFKSKKTGKEFSAKLTMDKAGKVSFSFK